MPAFCAVRGCGTRHQKGVNISFHAFPTRDAEMLRLWLRAVGREDLQPKSHHRVCSQHFKASCFYAGLDRPCLRPEAVPTEFSGCRERVRNYASKKLSATPLPVVESVASLYKARRVKPNTRQSQCRAQAEVKLTSSSSQQQEPHSRATRAATKVQQTANQASKRLQTRSTGTNTTLSPIKDAPAQARDASLEGQPLPKKRMFNLQQEAKGQSESQAKGSKDASTSQPAHFEKLKSVTANGSKSEEDPDGDNMLNCSGGLEVHTEVVGQTVNRDLDSGEPGPETTATGALFLHTYCGERREPEEVVKLKLLLRLAKRRLGVAERKLKRKSEAYNELLNANKELKFELSLAQRPTQQQFSVSDRLPQELLRDWHENAGRVPHARRYSATTLRFAADLHSCSRTAYEHVAQWLPMPTLYLVRRHAAMSSQGDGSRESGGAAAATTPSSKSETTSVGPRDTTLPASRFASSVPRYRKVVSWIPAAASKPNVSTFSPAPCTVKLENAPVMQASHSAPTVFVIKNAKPPEMGTPPDAATLPEMALSTEAATSSEMTTMPETAVATSSETTTSPVTEVATSSEMTTTPETEVATLSEMTTTPETGVATSSETTTSPEVEAQPDKDSEVGTETQPGTKTPLDTETPSEGRRQETDTQLNTETISGSHDTATIMDTPSVQTVTAIFVPRTLAL